MGKFAWCTDIHLDFMTDQGIVQLAQQLAAPDPEGIIISGDISTANKLVYHLSVLEKSAQRRIYFVLGNHDYYGGSVEDVRKNMRELTNISQYLRYLPTMAYQVLSPTTALVGHDGWYDALNGDAKKSNFGMTDWIAIREFAMVSRGGTERDEIIEVAKRLAHEGVMHVYNGIKGAAKYHKHIVVVTHVPPFAESHIYNGRVGDAHAQPWFTSKMMGDMLLQAAKAFPQVQFTVLAGHTHGRYAGQVTPNLNVRVGEAEYGQPKLQEVITFP